ncbi:hypothetical protein [Nocardia rhizosphaerihabitans]|nr:hypothetical protein [Nocardia rhizosphaerihabitans]
MTRYSRATSWADELELVGGQVRGAHRRPLVMSRTARLAMDQRWTFEGPS